MSTPTSCTPKAVNRRAVYLTLGLIAAGFIVFIVAMFMTENAGAVQLVALLLITLGLFVASKFLFVTYTYSISEPNASGVRFFLIEQASGKRSSLICRINLLRITAVEDIDPKAPAVKEQYFTYVASMGGGRYQMITARGDKAPVRVKIEADAAFIAALREAVAAYQTPATEDEE